MKFKKGTHRVLNIRTQSLIIAIFTLVWAQNGISDVNSGELLCPKALSAPIGIGHNGGPTGWLEEETQAETRDLRAQNSTLIEELAYHSDFLRHPNRAGDLRKQLHFVNDLKPETVTQYFDLLSQLNESEKKVLDHSNSNTSLRYWNYMKSIGHTEPRVLKALMAFLSIRHTYTHSMLKDEVFDFYKYFIDGIDRQDLDVIALAKEAGEISFGLMEIWKQSYGSGSTDYAPRAMQRPNFLNTREGIDTLVFKEVTPARYVGPPAEVFSEDGQKQIQSMKEQFAGVSDKSIDEYLSAFYGQISTLQFDKSQQKLWAVLKADIYKEAKRGFYNGRDGKPYWNSGGYWALDGLNLLTAEEIDRLFSELAFVQKYSGDLAEARSGMYHHVLSRIGLAPGKKAEYLRRMTDVADKVYAEVRRVQEGHLNEIKPIKEVVRRHDIPGGILSVTAPRLAFPGGIHHLRFNSEGLVIDKNGELFSTSEQGEMLIVKKNGELLSAKGTGIGTIPLGNHAVMARWQPVVAALEWVVKDGRVIQVEDSSGHYQPTHIDFCRAIAFFEVAGVDISRITKVIDHGYHPLIFPFLDEE